MLTLFNPHTGNQSLEDRILAMTDHAVCTTVPQKLRESGLFTDLEVDFIVAWLVEYRAQRHLAVIE